MEIRCPYCAFLLILKGVHQGRFSPTCPRCKEKFALIVPEGEDAQPTVKALKRADGTLPPTTAAPAKLAAVAGATAPPMAAAVSKAVASPVMATAAPAPAAPVKTQSPRPAAAPAATAPPRASRPPAETRPPSETVRSSETVPPEMSPANIDLPSASVTAHAPPTQRAGDSHKPSPVDDADMPAKLGGYQVERKLGQGGMGAVYLARQLSLDRNVALKVLSPTLSKDAAFVARFTREAYAAAQLTHHNIVQVYDIGEQGERHFFSMEFVEGETLNSLVNRDGKLEPETAVGYALQAARGLKFAHDQGLIHRDVKPDNLLLNNQGIVKVADLGLVKKRGVADIAGGANVSGAGTKLAAVQSANATGFDMSMGTPAYMAPEQARDAARVDGRADIYSLGCTMYDLLTGRPPFTGKTALEVISKHASEPITPPDVVSRRVPKEVSGILMKMVAKKPEDRFKTMGDCIRAMEEFLGQSSAGPFKPKEQHAAALEQAVNAFNGTMLARVANYLAPGFLLLCIILAVGSGFFLSNLSARILWAGAFVGLAVLTWLGYIVVSGLSPGGNVVFRKLRQFAFGAAILDWLKFVMVVAVVGSLLYVFNLLPVWIGVAVAAVGLAAGFRYGLELMRDRQRKPQLDQIEEMLRTMRIRGLDEEGLREFVCRYAGNRWEEFYEALFGYDAKMEARRSWGLSLRGKPRPKFGAWRDALIAWVDGRVNARKQAREQKVLAKIEERKLAAEGMDQAKARKAAQRQAEKLVDRAALLKETIADARREADRRGAATAGPEKIAVIKPASLLDAGDSYDDGGDERVKQSWLKRKYGGLGGLLFGPTVRFPIALALLLIFFLWFHKANPDFAQNAGKATEEAFAQTHNHLSGEENYYDVQSKVTHTAVNVKYNPNDVTLPGVPDNIRHTLSGYGVGLAGALLLFSCLFRGWKSGAVALLGVAIMIIGANYVPGFGKFTPAMLAGAIGGFVCAGGAIYLRER